ncbi:MULTISPECIES: S-layer homology domain-containing protein [Saccharibacillus]|uniref:S-layer homology domain-containing protein n=1 Tax=Saccharibacillus TaxID=456492 RepID=UPI001238709D|nr:S-layer homology domain-containing protein [Saccharibacillus sp. WB 17]MWJ31798.1 hypothetical protein [Saccharibacillus sp. WB 17]
MKVTKKVLASLVVTASLMGSFSAQAAPTSEFKDLDKASSWSRDAITQAKLLNLFSGDANGNFRPNDQITREEMAKVVVELLQLPVKTSKAPSSFKDVSSTDWSAPFVEAVRLAGIMEGGGGQLFKPKERVTREQLAVVMVKMLNLPRPTNTDSLKSLKDAAAIHGWASLYVASALQSGLMIGTNGSFGPNAVAKREEAAMVAVRAYQAKTEASPVRPLIPTPAPTPAPVPVPVPKPVPTPVPVPDPTPIPTYVEPAPSTPAPAPTPVPVPDPTPVPVPGNSAPFLTSVKIEGKAAVGQTLHGSYTFNDPDAGDTETNTSFQWYAIDAKNDRTAIAGATGISYEIAPNNLGSRIEFEVRTNDSRGLAGAAVSALSSVVKKADLLPFATNVGILGNPEVGQVLTGSYTFNGNGNGEGRSVLKWYRLESDDTRTEVKNVTESPDKTYRATSADVGKRILFEVTPIDYMSRTGKAEASATDVIQEFNNAPYATNIIASGLQEVGQTLTVQYTFNDMDGDAESDPTIQWYRINGESVIQVIPGATARSYTLTADDANQKVMFELTVQDARGKKNVPIPSFAYPISPINHAPESRDVTLDGNRLVGSTLQANYVFYDEDGDGESGTVIKWYRTKPGEDKQEIVGVTGKSYLLTSADRGASITFSFTLRDGRGKTAPTYSISSGEIFQTPI